MLGRYLFQAAIVLIDPSDLTLQSGAITAEISGALMPKSDK